MFKSSSSASVCGYVWVVRELEIPPQRSASQLMNCRVNDILLLQQTEMRNSGGIHLSYPRRKNIIQVSSISVYLLCSGQSTLILDYDPTCIMKITSLNMVMTKKCQPSSFSTYQTSKLIQLFFPKIWISLQEVNSIPPKKAYSTPILIQDSSCVYTSILHME